MGLALALREWAGVVEALGSGEQTVMVRGYPARYPAFFLYPTFSYYTSTKSKPESFNEKFQPKYLKLARESAEATRKLADSLLVHFRYYAEVDEVLPIEESKTWDRLEPYFIWSTEHVKSYANSSTFLWVLRVYRLPEIIVIGRNAGGGPPTFYKHSEEISIDGSQPVLRDSEYEKVKSAIMTNVAKSTPSRSRGF